MADFIIHTRPDCAYCTKAKEVINESAFTYEEIVYSSDAERDEFKAQGFQTFPQVYYRGHHLGGYNELVKAVDSTW